MSHIARPVLTAAIVFALAACKPANPPADQGAAVADAPAASNPVAAVAEAVLPDAKERVVAAVRKFAAATSYHADMHIQGGPRGPIDNTIDFVAPDRYRMSMPGQDSQVIVGGTMYMSAQGRTMKVPIPPDTLAQWRDPGRLGEVEAGMTATDQGSDPVDGQPARKYAVHATNPKPADTTIWIGETGMPLQIAAQNPMGDVTIKYSRINDPSIVIEAPK